MIMTDGLATLRTRLETSGLAAGGRRLLFREWTPTMLRDGAVVLLKVWIQARSQGLTFQYLSTDLLSVGEDGTVAFDGFEALVPSGANTPALTTFFRSVLGPLMAVHHQPGTAGLIRRAGSLSAQEFLAFRNSLVLRLPGRIPERVSNSRMAPLMCLAMYPDAAKVLRQRGLNDDGWLDRVLPKLLGRFQDLRVDGAWGRWTDYYTGIDIASMATKDKLEDIDGLTTRHCEVFEVMQSLPGSYVLDVGANQGLFSVLATRAGHSVTAIDHDIGAVDALYRFNRSHRKPILPAVVDFYELEGEAAERFQAPYVLALGFTHHLYLVEGMGWERIADGLARLTGDVLVTEFKHQTAASHPERVISEDHRRGYTLDNFVTALRRSFGTVDFEGSDRQRKLLVCRKH